MPSRFDALPQRRALIDRRRLAGALAALPAGDAAAMRRAAHPLFKAALETARTEIARRLTEHPGRGGEAAAAYAYVTDQLLRCLWDFTLERLYPLSNPTAAERLTLIAVGGYGRGEMALHSDVDIAFLTPWKQTGWSEQVIESMLYALWDLGLKVGHSSRSLDEMVRMAKSDLTIRTALL
ncbi:MAG: bifunctional uridylyltransferase/uridylyl-removing protein, partial [Sphingomonadales bacterium]